MRLLLLAFLAACTGAPPTDKDPVTTDHDLDGYDDSVDCDDEDADLHPDAEDLCDGVDNDCDGAIDEDAPAGTTTWFPDADGDSFGDPDGGVTACEWPDGYVPDGTDCDDAQPAAFPGNPEVCDGVDYDCDGRVDADASDAGTLFLDADGDGYGDEAVSVVECDGAGGYAAEGGDCDDGNASVHPGATEVCEDTGVDEDCDALVNDADESVSGRSAFFADRDGDGHGDAAAPTVACVAPEAHAASNDDCDDTNAAAHPGADEVCRDRTDNDCDGDIDEDCTGDTGGGDTGEPVDTGIDTGGDASVCDGNNTTDSYDDGYSMGGPGLLLGVEYTPTTDISVSRIEFFTGEGSGTNTVGIWSEDSSTSAPGTDLGTSSWSMDRANGWQGADLPSCLTLTAGTTYWVVWGPVNGAQSSWDSGGSSVNYRGSFDGGRTWNGPFSNIIKYRLYCCE